MFLILADTVNSIKTPMENIDMLKILDIIKILQSNVQLLTNQLMQLMMSLSSNIF
jgi:hypothetical protein